MKNIVPAPSPIQRPKPTLICEVCCDKAIIEAVENGYMILYCPDHMVLCIKDGEVVAFQSHGVRQ